MKNFIPSGGRCRGKAQMYCLLGLLFCFLNSCLLCASSDSFFYDEFSFDEMPGYAALNTPDEDEVNVKKSSDKILRILQMHKHIPCSYAFLIGEDGFLHNQKRELYTAIITLRNSGHNIVHNTKDESFTLYDGRRARRPDCYQDALWTMLNANSHLAERGDVSIALDLSDNNFYVQPSGVLAVKTVWKLTFQEKGCQTNQEKGCQTKLFAKAKAWNVILRDFRVYGKKYYQQHPDVQETFSRLDMVNFKRMFSFYTAYAEKQDPKNKQISDSLISCMVQSPEGVTLQEIQDFLHDSLKEKIDVWAAIGIFVRCGYGGWICHDKGRFFWCRTPSESPAPHYSLINEICNLFEISSSCNDITLALYKKGVFTVNAFDVKNILDILRKTGRLKSRCEGDADSSFEGLCEDARYMQILQESNTYRQIAEGWSPDISVYLKTEVYPKYFGWCDPVVSKSRKKNHNSDSFQPEGSEKKQCLGYGVLASEEPTEEQSIEGPPLKNDEIMDEKSFEKEEDYMDYLLRRFSSEEIYFPDYEKWLDPAETSGDVAPQQCVNTAQATSFNAHTHTTELLSGRSSDSEADSDGACATKSVKACAQKRQKLLLEYLTQKENEFCSAEELQALYGEQGTKETVLEDAVSLIYRNHNIEYSREREQYRLRPGLWSVQPPMNLEHNPESKVVRFFCQQLKEASFAALNVGEKTYHLYEHGYQSVPLSSVALLVIVRRPGFAVSFSDRERRLMALKDKVLEKEEIQSIQAYQKIDSVSKFGRVRREDISSVEKSLTLYTDGRAIIQKNKKPEIASHKPTRSGRKMQIALKESVRKALTEKKGQPVLEDYLKTCAKSSAGHSNRELYRVIAELRAEGMNIVHNADQTFTLYDDYRIAKNGYYRRVIWQMLDKQPPESLKVKDIFLAVSDLGYNPSWTVTENIFALKKLCTNSVTVPAKRRVAWSVVVAEGVLRDANYYHPYIVEEHLNKSDMNMLSACWALYNRIVYNLDVDVAQQAKGLLEKQTQSVSLEDIYRSLFINWRKSSDQKTDAWNVVSGLMRGGYAGQIDLIDGRVVWQSGAPNIAQTSNALFSDFCTIPLGYEYGPATIFLHKRGQLTVSPWDVEQLLDIFAFFGLREPNRCASLQALWENIENGCERIENLNRKDAIFIKRIQWLQLQSTGFQQSVQNGYVNLEELLTTEEWLSESDPNV